jgi:predicted DNA-binding protein (UPF0251 family)
MNRPVAGRRPPHPFCRHGSGRSSRNLSMRRRTAINGCTKSSSTAIACMRVSVILLVGLEGMSYEAAAQILEVPVGTVRSRLSRGRDALRQLMDMPERARTRDRFAEAA